MMFGQWRKFNIFFFEVIKDKNITTIIGSKQAKVKVILQILAKKRFYKNFQASHHKMEMQQIAIVLLHLI